MENNKEILRTENLVKSYRTNGNEIMVLKGINISVNWQELVAIMGKSGSGKTTLLKQLAIIDRPTSGKIFLKEKDTYSIRGDKLATVRRKDIGFVYQDYYLMDSLSVLENIMLPSILDHCEAEECISRAGELAQTLGVDKLLDKHVFELSGGEKQRVAICRALVNNPDLILADEPTGNLDTGSAEVVIDYLKMINQTMGKTIVIVTHDEYIASCCNRVIFVKDGVVETELTKAENISQDEFFGEIVETHKEIVRP